MNGLANTSDTEQQTNTVKPSAGHAESVTMLGISRQDISRLGGIWPPDGTIPKTATAMYYRNVWPAICTNKDGSGISVDDLTKLSKDELRRLCERQNRLDRMASQSYDTSQIITKKRPHDTFWRNLPSMSEKEKQKHIADLREERRNLLLHDNTTAYNYRMRKTEAKLYALTGNPIYAYAYDTA